MKHLLLIILAGFPGTPAFAKAPRLSSMQLTKCTYTLKNNEVMSEAVNKLVTSSKNFPLRTWGKSGWLDVTEKLNGNDFDGNAMKPGNSFDILVPIARLKYYGKKLKNCGSTYYLVRTSQKPTTANVSGLTANAEPAKTLKENDLAADFESLQKIMPVIKRKGRWFFLMRFKTMVKEVSPIVETPEKLPPTTNDIPDYPAIPEPLAEQPKEPAVPDLPPLTADELTDEKIAELSDEEAENIDPEVVEDKAAEASIFDSYKPGMNKLFKGLRRKTAAGIVGLRFGYPLVNAKTLPSKVKTLGLLIELRGDTLKGLRYGYDFSPKGKVKKNGIEESFAYSRHSLGWAFEIPVNWIINQIHIIPRIGSYSIESELAIALDDGSIESRNFRIKNGLAVGWEFDVEKAAYFSILRGWIAQDISGKIIGINRNESVTSLKAGIDASVKGGGFSLFGSRISTTYLAFLANERIRLQGTNETSGDFNVLLEVPLAGLGMGLSW